MMNDELNQSFKENSKHNHFFNPVNLLIRLILFKIGVI